MDSNITNPNVSALKNITVGQNCTSNLKLFSKSSNRPIVALSSFPGSGNTWARHLLHMASGYWSGNSRDIPSTNHLVRAGWPAETIDCWSRETVVQKTHKWHGDSNNRCNFEKSIIIMRNPFDALMSDFKLSQGSKTSEPEPSVFEGDGFPNYIQKKAQGWYTLHYNWINSHSNIDLLWTCFDRFVGTVRMIIFELHLLV